MNLTRRFAMGHLRRIADHMIAFCRALPYGDAVEVQDDLVEVSRLLLRVTNRLVKKEAKSTTAQA